MNSFFYRLRRWAIRQSFRLPGGAGHARHLVRAGYDEMAAAYAEWARSAESNRKRDRWVEALARSLPAGTTLLDLGCGPGHEMACWSRAGLKLTGVDLSPANLARARTHAPGATFLCADMTRQMFSLQSFEVVVAFYSLIHVPRRQQARLLRRTQAWLKPGGLFIANLAARPFAAMYDGHWLGTPMYWSSLGAGQARRLLKKAGYSLLREELAVETDFGRKNTFFWFVARKPGGIADAAAWSSCFLHTLAQHDPPAEPVSEEEGVWHG